MEMNEYFVELSKEETEEVDGGALPWWIPIVAGPALPGIWFLIR